MSIFKPFFLNSQKLPLNKITYLYKFDKIHSLMNLKKKVGHATSLSACTADCCWHLFALHKKKYHEVTQTIKTRLDLPSPARTWSRWSSLDTKCWTHQGQNISSSRGWSTTFRANHRQKESENTSTTLITKEWLEILFNAYIIYQVFCWATLIGQDFWQIFFVFCFELKNI